jgi:hypothetical protein
MLNGKGQVLTVLNTSPFEITPNQNRLGWSRPVMTSTCIPMGASIKGTEDDREWGATNSELRATS